MTSPGNHRSEKLPPPEEAPTRVRLGVLGFLCSLSFVLYLDRVCISQAIDAIQADLGLSKTQIGYALGAFTIAYGLFEVPTGRWGDRFGSRRVLARIVVWWSIFTALTGAATGLTMLVAVRFLFGAGEAGAYPNVLRVVARWFPLGERGTAQGIVITSGQLGGALAPMVAAYVIAFVGWRLTFVAFSSLGIFWAVAFYWWFRDDPAAHSGTNAAERALIATPGHDAPAAEQHPPIPWRLILGSATIWLLGIFQTCSSLLSYFFMSWYPTYLKQGRQVDSIEAGQLASLVLFGSAVGCLGSGFINDWLARVTNRHPARYRVYGFCSMTVAAVALVISVQCVSPRASSVWAALAFMAAISQQATLWAVTTEISGPHLGVVFGFVNSMGVPGAFVSATLPGRFVDWMGSRGYTGREQWDPAFYAYAAVLLVGAGCWLFVNANQRLADRQIAMDAAPVTD